VLSQGNAAGFRLAWVLLDNQPLPCCAVLCCAVPLAIIRRGTLARQVADWRPCERDQHMLWLLLLLRDVACGLKLLHHHNVVHADLVRR
jgi:hypothetical protein